MSNPRRRHRALEVLVFVTRQVQRPVGLLLEQPASPRRYMPECVYTEEWRQLKKEFDLQEVTFCQGPWRSCCETTVAGNLELNM